MKKALRLQTESNARLKKVSSDKLEVHFPQQDGVLTVGRSQFKDHNDLLSYLAQTIPIRKCEIGYRATISRKGKYRRLNKKGDDVFAFGDPILDLITDEYGWLTIASERHNLQGAELAEPAFRGGGLHAIDLRPRPGEFENVISSAALGTREFSLIEVSSGSAVLASTNPATLWFYQPSAKMRFRAFKKNYYVGWKMGADIETWGRDFSRAEIQSNYGFWIYGRACGIAKHDSDSDTNDDYVDEYEWGIASPPPTGVGSSCSATWGGERYFGFVSKGDCDYWI